jgi:hypothetical protein
MRHVTNLYQTQTAMIPDQTHRIQFMRHLAPLLACLILVGCGTSTYQVVLGVNKITSSAVMEQATSDGLGIQTWGIGGLFNKSYYSAICGYNNAVFSKLTLPTNEVNYAYPVHTCSNGIVSASRL